MIINRVNSKEEAEQEIIRRAKETCSNVDRVTSIKIDAEIIPFPNEAINVNINKNYIAEFEKGEQQK